MAYSDDEILSSLQNCYSDNGKVTTRLFEEFDGPSTKTVINRFGSFNEALLKAGIPINDTWNNYSEDKILSDIKKVARQNGSIKPKYFGGDFVSRGQIDRKFGSIGRAAGEANCHEYLPDYFECHECGGLFQHIGSHISESSCNSRKLSNTDKEIYKGILLGDGYIGGRDSTPWFAVSMSGESGRRFTEWLQKNISIFCIRRMKELESDSHKDVYTLRTQSHAYFDSLSSWYDSGTKEYPNNLSLTPTILKMWYISDGSLSNSGPIITCWNESNRSDFLLSLFDEIGLSATWQDSNNDIYIQKKSHQDFFNYIGEPVPGFEYKWP